MARFIVSMPDEMLKALDATARREQRSRSELLREVVRRHLASASVGETAAEYGKKVSNKRTRKISRHGSARARLLALGLGTAGCPGLDRLIGSVREDVDMREVLAIGKKLTGLSKEIVDSRDDRL